MIGSANLMQEFLLVVYQFFEEILDLRDLIILDRSWGKISNYSLPVNNNHIALSILQSIGRKQIAVPISKNGKPFSQWIFSKLAFPYYSNRPEGTGTVQATYSWAKPGDKIGWHFWLMWTLIYPLDRSQDSTAILQADSLTVWSDWFIVDKILSTLSITQS